MSEVEAVAEAWASIDGKLDLFKNGKIGGDIEGYYEGYMVDAQELIDRIAKRGYTLTPQEP